MRKQFEGKQSRKKEAGGDAVRSVPNAREPLGEMTWWPSPLSAQSATVATCSASLLDLAGPPRYVS